MQPFAIYTPTRILFGESKLAEFAQHAAKIGRHAFLVVGGGTVERLGFVQPLLDELQKHDVKVTFFRGIEPNPEAATINKAAKELKASGADFILPFGGGSTIDAAKAIAALVGSKQDDIWEFVVGSPKAGQLNAAIPIVAVPTTAATASEVTQFSVVSNRVEGGKSVLAHEFLKPALAWLNPVFTQGLSDTTTQDGAADILSHVFESYLLGGNDSKLADRYSEAVMSTVLEALPILLANPKDLDARADLVWAATLALNDYQLAGRNPAEFILHSVEHSLSAKHPELAHGRGLATLYPAYFRWLAQNGRAVDRLALLGSRLFGLEGSEADRAQAFITTFEGWLRDNGLLQSLEQVGVTEDEFEEIALYAVTTYGDGKQLNALGALPQAAIVEIFQLTARQGSLAAV